MKHTEPVPFEVAEQIRELGHRVRVARLRRRLDQAELARTCHIARTTLQRIEAGNPAVAVGSLYTVLWTLGLLATAAGTADPDADEHGKTLDAARQVLRARPSRTPIDDNNF
jgi:transcriptional regulator with XRE-family HTH domain